MHSLALHRTGVFAHVFHSQAAPLALILQSLAPFQFRSRSSFPKLLLLRLCILRSHFRAASKDVSYQVKRVSFLNKLTEDVHLGGDGVHSTFGYFIGDDLVELPG